MHVIASHILFETELNFIFSITTGKKVSLRNITLYKHYNQLYNRLA